MNKNINKKIMKSHLINNFLNTKNNIDRKAYNNQCNICVTLIQQDKKNVYNKLNTWDIPDNKTFWKKVKPSLKGYLCYKTIFCHKVALNVQLMNFFI